MLFIFFLQTSLFFFLTALLLQKTLFAMTVAGVTQKEVTEETQLSIRFTDAKRVDQSVCE